MGVPVFMREALLGAGCPNRQSPLQRLHGGVSKRLPDIAPICLAPQTYSWEDHCCLKRASRRQQLVFKGDCTLSPKHVILHCNTRIHDRINPDN